MELVPEQVFVGALTVWATVPVGVRTDLKRQDVAEGMESLGKLKEMKKASLSPSRKILEIMLVSPQGRDQLLQTGLPLKGKNVTLQFNLARQSTIDVSIMDAPLEFDNNKIKDEVTKYGDLEEWYDHEWTFKGHHIQSGIRVFRFNRLYRAFPQTLPFGGRQCRVLYTGDGKHRYDEKKKLEEERQAAARDEEERRRAEQEELEKRAREKEEQKKKELRDRAEKKNRDRQRKKAEEERLRIEREEKDRADEEQRQEEIKRERALQRAADIEELRRQHSNIPSSCAPSVETLVNAFNAPTEFDAEREDDNMEVDSESRKRGRDAADSDDAGGDVKRDREGSASSLELVVDEDAVSPAMPPSDGGGDGDVAAVMASLFGDGVTQETEEVEHEEVDELVLEEHEGDRIHHDTPNQAAVFRDIVVAPYITKKGTDFNWSWVTSLLLSLPDQSENRRLLCLDCITEWPRRKLEPFLALHYDDIYDSLRGNKDPRVPDMCESVMELWSGMALTRMQTEQQLPLLSRRIEYIVRKRLDVSKLYPQQC